MKITFNWIFVLVLFLVSCSASPKASFQVTVTSTSEPLKSETLLPTPTQVPQVLGRIFPEEFHGQTIWSDAGGNRDRNYKDQGWFCPPNGSTTNCKGAVIHFDVAIPKSFKRTDYVISPVVGYVENIYDSGGIGKSIVIVPTPWLQGVEDLLSNRERIDDLSNGRFSFKYSVNDVKSVALHLAHMIPTVKIGAYIKKGDILGAVDFDGQSQLKSVAYVIYIRMRDGTEWHFGPCDVPNEDEFCGKCTPGSPYCPYQRISK